MKEPLNQSPAPHPYASPDKKPLLGTSILLVEDYPLNVLFARRLLEGWGVQVDTAKNGQDALELLNPAKHKLVLMDLQMPVMDGFESSRRMRERGETLPIIALTAETSSEVDPQLEACGLNGVLTKPLQAERLLELILKLARS